MNFKLNLQMFGEKEKTEQEKLLEKIEGLEKNLKDIQDENTRLKTSNEELTGKLAKLKVDGLTQQIKTDTNVEEKKEEPTEFDFTF